MLFFRHSVLVLQTATDAPLLTQRLVLSDSRAVVQIINYDLIMILRRYYYEYIENRLK